MYDYREAMTEDVKQWITDEVDLADWTEDRGGLEQTEILRCLYALSLYHHVNALKLPCFVVGWMIHIV